MNRWCFTLDLYKYTKSCTTLTLPASRPAPVHQPLKVESDGIIFITVTELITTTVHLPGCSPSSRLRHRGLREFVAPPAPLTFSRRHYVMHNPCTQHVVGVLHGRLPLVSGQPAWAFVPSSVLGTLSSCHERPKCDPEDLVSRCRADREPPPSGIDLLYNVQASHRLPVFT